MCETAENFLKIDKFVRGVRFGKRIRMVIVSLSESLLPELSTRRHRQKQCRQKNNGEYELSSFQILKILFQKSTKELQDLLIVVEMHRNSPLPIAFPLYRNIIPEIAPEDFGNFSMSFWKGLISIC